MKGVYIVSKGGVSKVGSSYFAERRSRRVAMELFGSSDGCEFFIVEHSEHQEVELLAHKYLANYLLSSSPVYCNELFSVSLKKAIAAVVKASKLIQNNPIRPPINFVLEGRVGATASVNELDEIKFNLESVGMSELFSVMNDRGEINVVTIPLLGMIANMKAALDASREFIDEAAEFIASQNTIAETNRRKTIRGH